MIHYKKECKEWMHTTNARCVREIGLAMNVPRLHFMRFDPKTDHFSIGMKGTTDKQNEHIDNWCKTHMTKEKFPKLIGYNRWFWNRKFMIIKFKVDIDENPPQHPRKKIFKRNIA